MDQDEFRLNGAAVILDFANRNIIFYQDLSDKSNNNDSDSATIDLQNLDILSNSCKIDNGIILNNFFLIKISDDIEGKIINVIMIQGKVQTTCKFD